MVAPLGGGFLVGTSIASMAKNTYLGK